MVCFDDFYGWVPYSTLLALVDQYQCSVQNKGGMVTFSPFVCVFTSNASPRDWYDYTKPHIVYGALERRLDHVYEHRFPSVDLDGVPKTAVVVTTVNGSPRFHPLYKYFKEVPVTEHSADQEHEQHFFLPEDVLAEQGDTQTIEDAELEYFYDKMVDRP